MWVRKVATVSCGASGESTLGMDVGVDRSVLMGVVRSNRGKTFSLRWEGREGSWRVLHRGHT